MVRRPDKYSCITVRASRFLPPKGYFAITFFGRILIHRRNFGLWEAQKTTRSGQILLHHEWIHVKQAVSTHNSWLCYYLRYIYFYLKNRPLRYGSQFAYYANPFEMEAYAHENDLDYARTEPAEGWRGYAKLTVGEKYDRFLKKIL